MTPSLRSFFLLDPQVIFLNHGSFGACPSPVFTYYQDLQRYLESQPVRFLGREYASYEHNARQALAGYLHADPLDIVFVPNATHGVNIVMHSLKLEPGDEILTTDQEYGACNSAWEFYCQKTGVNYIHQSIPAPFQSPDEIVEQLWQRVTPRTKLIYFSHVTSPTGLILPAQAICQRARQEGILTAIDGAHAPGQIALDLPGMGVDFYTGNCHKWMMSPKGAAFFYARHEVQPLIEPLVVGFGWSREVPAESTRFQNYFQWSGTRDPSACFSVPAAIRFAQERDWETVRQASHVLLQETIARISALSGTPSIYAADHLFRQMGVAPLPAETDLPALSKHLYEDYNIEVPCVQWKERKFLRISVQGYNTPEDLDTLVTALENASL